METIEGEGEEDTIQMIEFYGGEVITVSHLMDTIGEKQKFWQENLYEDI